MQAIIDFLLHFDRILPQVFEAWGPWLYLLVFAIIFCETGLVVMPFLPGDSLLFALGAFAGIGELNIWILLLGLIFAAILGDSLNYLLGERLGAKLLSSPRQRLFKPEHYEKAHLFYQKHGGKAIIMARFVPIVRTFAPFVAGVARMEYRKFLSYNVIGGITWVCLFLGLGYLLGQMEWVKANFKLLTLIIIAVSVLPIVWELWAAKHLRPKQ
jgi:membrane-associated protein